MLDMYNTTNDIEATYLRKNLPREEGFPVWLVSNETGKQLFVARKSMEEYLSTLSSDVNSEIELLMIKDVKFLSYEVDY